VKGSFCALQQLVQKETWGFITTMEVSQMSVDERKWLILPQQTDFHYPRKLLNTLLTAQIVSAKAIPYTFSLWVQLEVAWRTANR